MEQIRPTNAPVTDIKRWVVALTLSTLFFVFGIGYVVAGYDASFLQSVSFVAASTASLLFATALSMGSISHFIGWPNMRAGFQKQIGITAFLASLLYITTLPLLYPELYWSGLSTHFFSADVVLGLLAMVIFTAMVFINNPLFARYVSKSTVYFVLGLGYIGYALLVIRAILLEYPIWVEWFVNVSGVPPGRLVLSVIAVCVLVLRVAVAIDKHRNPPTVTTYLKK